MINKRYTDEEIEKALSLCGRTTEVVYCDQCPLCGEYECNREIKVLALDLINCQKSEIEKLKSNYSKLCKYTEKKELELAEINADISWFREAKISRLAPAIKEIKAEAYAEACKEFTERLKEHFKALEYNAKTDRKTVKVEELKEQMDWAFHTVTIETIDNLLKEIVGEKIQ